MAEATNRYAVVTGANKGIGFGICKQLASNGIVVVLTARDEKRGLEAVQKLRDGGLSDHVVFHRVDVADQATVTSLAYFIKNQFGKLDILVNNAGVGGVGKAEHVSDDELIDVFLRKEGALRNWKDVAVETPEMAEECLNINNYGAKRMVEALIPLLQLSDSPRIVTLSSSRGKLLNIPNEWAKGVLGDLENLTEERVDEVLREFVKDFKDGSLEAKGWPTFVSAYTLSAAAMIAYTRILAKKHPSFRINCVCPGFAKTDMNLNSGILSVEEGADNVVRLAMLPNGGPSGCFFNMKEETPF